MTDSKLLRAKIEEKGLKYKTVAKALGLSPYGLDLKINNRSEFKVSEMETLSELLGLDTVEQKAIFFAKKVESNSTLEEGA